MPRNGDIRISADEKGTAAANELLAELAGRGLTVVLEEPGDEGGGQERPGPSGPPPLGDGERVDVLVRFTDGDATDPCGSCLEALERDLAGAVVLVSPLAATDELSEDVPLLRADPAWGPEALARVTEMALALAREREGRVRAEARLAELARAHESLDESFSAIVSHDLRTPVTTLRLLQDFLASQLGARADLLTRNERVSTDELLGIMARSLDKMEALIDDMLEAWRVSPGVTEKTPGPVDLNAVAGDIVAGLFPVAMHKDIVLDLATDPGAGLVRAESRRVGQVVSNLVGNALKFTPRGGAVTVTTRAGGGANAGGAVLEVADTGPGIAEGDREKIFQRFGRGGARATGGEPSTGLGLYICREIVELYGGRIWFESAPGKGSRFFVFFPGESED